ncbi:MAG: NupC/NupG family nucleoside CNT transporter [Candidatus Cyclonatronum sp.]|uniref:NupC/NupG family nucleoside CNT transporter n=1 Tax=Cyclonatronum sp. TaxID=3024185 RepID=UPI0025C29843|nr:nucleoside transporter C-terminal domain-containing protein [Cyclonatronum sp.]MCC5934674.1 NupC/NupG family nucleoside CNT transporter [Balneolales bacterium]MCH8486495.1 NupC/NupG family nucleoside CNT transporter [Cyclonatronum sp.]
MELIRGIIGMAVILGIALALSNNRKAVSWRLVGIGLGIQLTLAVFILKGSDMAEFFGPLGWPKLFFSWVSSFFVLVLEFTTAGAAFIFGDLAYGPGTEQSLGFFFAFQVLPTIVFFASITTLLYHYGVLQFVVKIMATGMQKLLGTSGAESLSVVANIFVGQTEAPLVVKPYIEKMTQSELLAVMTGGMATIAGGIMAAYIQMLGDAYAQANGLALEIGRQLFAEQLLGASLMAAPAALVIAKILYPETEEPVTRGEVKISVEKTDANGIEAASSGATEGLKLALNVGAMLLAFIAILALLNHFLGIFGDFTGINNISENFDFTIQGILGILFAPLAFLIGVPWVDAINVGSMIGTKIVLTEFIAFIDLSQFVMDGALEERTIFMATFALCGFANFSSIAIQIGGIGGLAPSRKSDLAKFGLLAVLAGTLANMMTATIAGVLY